MLQCKTNNERFRRGDSPQGKIFFSGVQRPCDYEKLKDVPVRSEFLINADGT